jgi:Protein of unknown function (DUF3592)
MAINLTLAKGNRATSYLAIFQVIFVLCALAMIAKTLIDTYREKQHAKWPGAVGTIMPPGVRIVPARNHDEWYIELPMSYSVGGHRLAAGVRSQGGALWEELPMRRWAAAHPPGTSLPIRYDPEQPSHIVVAAGAMPDSEPQSPGDLKVTLLFMALAAICMVIRRAAS